MAATTTSQSSTSNVLGLAWTFGLNKSILGGVHNLSDSGRKVIFYAAAHTGVLYDYANGKQQLLQGHCNQITALTTSSDKRFLLTADQGNDSMIIIWDTTVGSPATKDTTTDGPNNAALNALPIRTIFDSHGGAGVIAAEFTNDSKYVVTLGNDSPQTISIWDWTTESDEPVVSTIVDGEAQTSLKINPEDFTEFLTTGPHSVNFFTWSPDAGISQHVPVLSPKDFKHTPSSFTHSTFLPSTPSNTIGQAISATADGDVIVWTDRSLNNLSVKMERGKKAGVKIMRLHTGAINIVMVMQGKWLVTGGEDGFVRVYDMQFRLIVWFERLRAGPISSISLGGGAINLEQDDGADSLSDADIPALIVATKHSRVLLLTNLGEGVTRDTVAKGGIAANAAIKTLLEGQYDSMHGLAVHPTLPKFAVGGYSGWVHVWDYTTKQLVTSRRFEEPHEENPHIVKIGKKKQEHNADILKVQCMAFSPDGKTLAIGFTNGTVRLVHTQTLQDFHQSTPASHRPGIPGYAASKKPIMRAVFSNDSQWMAIADEGYAVGVFRFGPKDEWGFVGRCRAHYGEIVGLVFVPPAPDMTYPRLLSISHDRQIAEYDLEKSSITAGIVISSLTRIDQTHSPLCAVLHPSPPIRGPHDAPQYYILTANTGAKFRLYTAESGMCRRTVVAPRYGGELRGLAVVNKKDGQGGEDDNTFLAYMTTDKVIGLIKLPLDGNPHKSMGLIAHPGAIAALVPTPTGSHLLTVGCDDGVINLWSINPAALDTQIALGGEELEPFLDLLFAGQSERAAFVREMEDYFYYAQLRSQGEDVTRNRQISTTVALGEVPSIMQAMGYYPSFQEIEDMLNEVRYSGWFEGYAADLRESVTFEELIRLYVNHRPIEDYAQSDIDASLAHAKRLEPGVPRGIEGVLPPISAADKISREGLMALLQQYGETLSSADFLDTFQTLLINDPRYNGTFPDEFSSQEFVEEILGLIPQVTPQIDV
ncbi:uncharacterized protein SPPG_09006 [Spizellomyces punctatus DAOM BR117]|uniref:Cilia- and flagella-associated protein 251 n=1 Tax=Spizellomyces punctatus (strain DAOM BR117) TaxID=645134 RepID=A0A0L0HQ17_SPIPD|nr:uncharacterized protein SPPG_09006 [Spizellomyces punctatus DAOM BR117]KND03187.1 hypothetical protein SPPG_09006 [Spizellomyces punctatus DAOM BR117]|eukprot:XP_016611226.1 hypothetical protein SPPG_09006 [Spizellomyces punctatus DAOM BR117]